MIVHIVTLFPEQIESFLSVGILQKAREKGLLDVRTVQLRDFTDDRHQTVDDYPYGGGGAGMILKPEPLFRALEKTKENCETKTEDVPVVLTTPNGRKLDAGIAREYSGRPEWIVICGHYGGVDQRVIDEWVTDQVSIGDYVLNGGELAALVMLETAARFVPGVLGNEASAQGDTFEDGLLGAPLYTRPAEYKGREVPPVLLSGDHARVDAWRREQKLRLTARRRPDLLENVELSEEDREFIGADGPDVVGEE